MDSSFLDAMRRATQATREGDATDATRIIREALSGSVEERPAPADDFDGVTIDGELAGESERPRSARPDPDASTDPAPMLSQSWRGAAGGRDYRLFLPPQAPDGVRGLVMMLHGCTQTPDDFARGTAMNAAAAREGLIVAYPGQTSAYNPNGCWNWFEPGHQSRDTGEPAILAGIARDIARVHDVPPGAVFAAGLSAGGAMAAILGRAYPDVFSAIGVHSGLPAGAARDVPSAFAAMNGTGQGAAAPIVPGTPHARTMIVHGERDRTVDPANAARLLAALSEAHPDAVPERDPAAAPGLDRLRLRRPDGTVVVEYWHIPQLGHAWSGGDPAGSYTAPRRPDASEGLVRFFLDPKAG